MQPSEHTYAIVVTWRNKLATSTLNLSADQTIAALLQINRILDLHGASADRDLRVLVLEESDTRH